MELQSVFVLLALNYNHQKTHNVLVSYRVDLHVFTKNLVVQPIKLTYYYMNYTDKNECTQFNPCDQICTNTEGSFTCSCRHGYRYDENGNTCEGILLYNTSTFSRFELCKLQILMSVKKQLKMDLCHAQKIQHAEILQDHTIALVSEAMLGSMALANVGAKQHAVVQR